MARGTTTRKATHSRSLVTHARCPTCGCQHVTETPIHGVPTRTCGMCGHQWKPEPKEDQSACGPDSPTN